MSEWTQTWNKMVYREWVKGPPKTISMELMGDDTWVVEYCTDWVVIETVAVLDERTALERVAEWIDTY